MDLGLAVTAPNGADDGKHICLFSDCQLESMFYRPACRNNVFDECNAAIRNILSLDGMACPIGLRLLANKCGR
ncbi:hypothetical protein [Rhizobium sp. CB3171]|uniref:hypothetical protein n=1 Tax=Rhizobium sp. CB3171 TaxID=3039157 RepID=UPI0032C23F79